MPHGRWAESAWGSNANANLGLGDFEQRNVPVRVDPDATWTDVAADWFHTCGLQTDGSLWCWATSSASGSGLAPSIRSSRRG